MHGRLTLFDLQARRQTAGEEEMVLAEGQEGERRRSCGDVRNGEAEGGKAVVERVE